MLSLLKNVPPSLVGVNPSSTSQEGSTYIEGENRKRRNINCRRKGN